MQIFLHPPPLKKKKKNLEYNKIFPTTEYKTENQSINKYKTLLKCYLLYAYIIYYKNCEIFFLRNNI